MGTMVVGSCKTLLRCEIGGLSTIIDCTESPEVADVELFVGDGVFLFVACLVDLLSDSSSEKKLIKSSGLKSEGESQSLLTVSPFDVDEAGGDGNVASPVAG